MGYNHTGDFSFPDSFNSRRPRPLSPSALTFTHHLGAMATTSEQNRREQFSSQQQVVVSSRWNPTPEQLQTLEELYRRGTRTPSADQIQQITAQLRRYGRIEGKNVFYWFQNHKARERQKRRRQLESAEAGRTLNCMANSAGTKESAAAAAGPNMRTRFEVGDTQQTKNWSPSHTTLTPEKSRSVKMGTKIVNGRATGLVEMEGGNEKVQKRKQEQNDTWRHQMSAPPPHQHHRQFIPAATNISTAASSSSSSSTSSTAKLLLNQTLNFFSDPPEAKSIVDSGFQTLQLFPLRDGDQNGNGMDPAFMAAASMDSESHVVNAPHHYQFFEFLPLKNY
ncbi:unnamed protein product [Cuscuta europaea]|uniref:Homeobox domain-containing protein n=1 Tax=Cuscuta europaea TaxID=41803 RepID=A0A9P0Z183_CUSEU|nr:unnamed protein product [Cuscuta europaea]